MVLANPDFAGAPGGNSMSEDFVTAIATTLSAQGGQLVVAGGKTVLASLYRLIRDRLVRTEPDVKALEAAVHHPNEPGHINELSRVLARALREDPAFARQVIAQWQKLSDRSGSDSDSTVNSFHGEARNVIQARDVHGGISF
jgi:hypothetical protein